MGTKGGQNSHAKPSQRLKPGNFNRFINIHDG
jgi:hypothetical protein